jgi:hydroxypyruvate isomerase
MATLAANISWIYTELPFKERFEAAAAAGFRFVEWNYAFDHSKEELRQLLADHSLQLALINVPAGDMAAGELGLAALDGRQADARAAFATALDYAEALRAPLVHYLAGKPLPGSDPAITDKVFLKNLCEAADLASSSGITLTLEPLNPVDRTGYHLMTVEHAVRLIKASGRKNIKLQLDVYHQQMNGGNIIQTIEQNLELLAHVQVAGVPGRHEPDVGEINTAAILSKLDELGYKGVIGCEYKPLSDTTTGLGWASQYLGRQA